MAHPVAQKVQTFYNKTPFPDYDLARFNSKDDLKLAAYPFAKVLDRSIPKDASIIDVGTGTGQLSAYLSLTRKNVYGIDFSDSSLKKARALKQKLGLDSWTLKKVDLMDPKQIKEIGQQFDYVLCMGVLHHTQDAYAGFINILPLLKPKGNIAIGLYNTYGRWPLKIRIFLAKTIFKNNNTIKDWFIRMQIGDIQDKERARGWWNDQYLHPHETTHSVGEVVNWFEKNGISFVQNIPTTQSFDESNLEIAGVWNQSSRPSFFARVIAQAKWIFTTHHEGGYWITFGRRDK